MDMRNKYEVKAKEIEIKIATINAEIAEIEKMMISDTSDFYSVNTNAHKMVLDNRKNYFNKKINELKETRKMLTEKNAKYTKYLEENIVLPNNIVHGGHILSMSLHDAQILSLRNKIIQISIIMDKECTEHYKLINSLDDLDLKNKITTEYNIRNSKYKTDIERAIDDIVKIKTIDMKNKISIEKNVITDERNAVTDERNAVTDDTQMQPKVSSNPIVYDSNKCSMEIRNKIKHAFIAEIIETMSAEQFYLHEVAIKGSASRPDYDEKLRRYYGRFNYWRGLLLDEIAKLELNSVPSMANPSMKLAPNNLPKYQIHDDNSKLNITENYTVDIANPDFMFCPHTYEKKFIANLCADKELFTKYIDVIKYDCKILYNDEFWGSNEMHCRLMVKFIRNDIQFYKNNNKLFDVILFKEIDNNMSVEFGLKYQMYQSRYFAKLIYSLSNPEFIEILNELYPQYRYKMDSNGLLMSYGDNITTYYKLDTNYKFKECRFAAIAYCFTGGKYNIECEAPIKVLPNGLAKSLLDDFSAQLNAEIKEFTTAEENKTKNIIKDKFAELNTLLCDVPAETKRELIGEMIKSFMH
jgi:hypothetical protein